MALLEKTVYHDHTEVVETLATRFREADAMVLIRERTPHRATSGAAPSAQADRADGSAGSPS